MHASSRSAHSFRMRKTGNQEQLQEAMTRLGSKVSRPSLVVNRPAYLRFGLQLRANHCDLDVLEIFDRLEIHDDGDLNSSCSNAIFLRSWLPAFLINPLELLSRPLRATESRESPGAAKPTFRRPPIRPPLTPIPSSSRPHPSGHVLHDSCAQSVHRSKNCRLISSNAAHPGAWYRICRCSRIVN